MRRILLLFLCILCLGLPRNTMAERRPDLLWTQNVITASLAQPRLTCNDDYEQISVCVGTNGRGYAAFIGFFEEAATTYKKSLTIYVNTDQDVTTGARPIVEENQPIIGGYEFTAHPTWSQRTATLLNEKGQELGELLLQWGGNSVYLPWIPAEWLDDDGNSSFLVCTGGKCSEMNVVVAVPTIFPSNASPKPVRLTADQAESLWIEFQGATNPEIDVEILEIQIITERYFIGGRQKPRRVTRIGPGESYTAVPLAKFLELPQAGRSASSSQTLHAWFALVTDRGVFMTHQTYFID